MGSSTTTTADSRSPPKPDSLRLDRAGQHDRGHLHGLARRVGRHHRAPGDLPGINLDPLSAGQHQLPALDDHGLPPRPGGAGGEPGQARRHVRPGQDVQRGLRGVHRSPRSCCPSTRSRATHGALWLIGWRLLQAVGGSMLMANSAAILTDAFPAERRGFALGTNQIAALAGMFIGLVAGGLLAAWDWRAVFWINLPGRRVRHALGVPEAARQRRAAARARSTGGATSPSPSASARCWSASPTASSPTRNNSMGWESPVVLGELIGGARAAGRSSWSSRPGSPSRCSGCRPVQDPRRSPRATWPACWCRSRAAASSSC